MGGICIQKSTFAETSKKSAIRKSNSKQSFLYSSFTYDPTYNSHEPNFFFFDLPHYCEIQYILRKANPQKYSQQLKNNIKRHIVEIEGVIADIRESGKTGGMANDKGMEGNIKIMSQEKEINMKKQGKQSLIQLQQSNQSKPQQTRIKQVQSQQLYKNNNILNFQLVSATLQYQDITQTLQFDIYLNQTKILSVTGGLSQNKWKPSSTNQVSVPDTVIQLQDSKKQVYIKIVTQLANQNAECTIPCNSMTFKYIIPVLQSCNIRAKADNEPLGHVHFRVEYVQDYATHREKVITDLQVRKKGLQAILQRMNNAQSGEILDKYLVVDQNNSSFRSSFRQD